MRIHSEFVPIKRSAGWIARQLNQPTSRDGAYARVGSLGELEVLKATCCSATNVLFEELLHRTKRNQPTPEALPAVFRCYGPAVTDSDKFVYTVWAIERLFEPNEAVDMRRARIECGQTYASLKPAYVRPLHRLERGDLNALNQALEDAQSACRTPDTWQGSADIALTMSRRTSGALRSTFQFLLEFVTTHQVQLDLLTRGNVMVNMFGHPCLSDPVCAANPEAEPAQPVQGSCLAALVPTKVSGIDKVRMEAFTTPPLNETELAERQASLKELGLAGTVYEWGTADHRRFLAQNPTEWPLWRLPGAANNLRAGRYAQLFST